MPTSSEQLQVLETYAKFEALKELNFKLLTLTPTHLKGGHIDQAWFRGKYESCDLVCRSPYYTCKDHDALFCTIYDSSTE